MRRRLLSATVGMVMLVIATSAFADSLTFSGTQGGVSASGTADFTFSNGELDIKLTNTTDHPDQITQAIEGITWVYKTTVTGPDPTFSATVTPITTINSNGTFTTGSPRGVDTAGNGWGVLGLNLLGTSNKDMILDAPLSGSPNGSLTNANGPTEVLSPVTFKLFSSAFTSSLQIKSATMVWGTGGLNAPEISDTETPNTPQQTTTPLPATAATGLALLVGVGIFAGCGNIARRRNRMA